MTPRTTGRRALESAGQHQPGRGGGGEPAAGGPDRLGIARRVSPAPQVLLGQGNSPQPRLQLVPQGQHFVLFDRHPAGRERSRPGVRRTRGGGHAAELRTIQRAARHLAADGHVSPRGRRLRENGRGCGARLYAEGSVQTAAGVSRHGAALPHESSLAPARKRCARQRPGRFPAREDSGCQRVRAGRRRWCRPDWLDPDRSQTAWGRGGTSGAAQ